MNHSSVLTPSGCFQLSLIEKITYSLAELFWGSGKATVKLPRFDLQRRIILEEDEAGSALWGPFAEMADGNLPW